MKPRIALSTKILLLAFANFLLLGLVGLGFAWFQFGLEFNSRLIGPARERVISTARQMALDLGDTPVEGRDQLMRRYADTYRVAFYVFAQQGGEQVAGPAIKLPEAVIEEMHKPPPPAERPPGRRGRGRGDEPEDRGPGRRALGPERPPPIFEASSSNPPLYWVGVGIPLREPGGEGQRPGVVLMTAPSFVGTPLFFDYKPWLAVTVALVAVFLLCWLPFIRSLTRAVTAISKVTEHIAEGRFEQHLPEVRRDELGLLAGSINRMAGRLAGFVTGQKRFLGDIAHELCAPIARIQFALGILEHKTEPGTVDDLQDEVNHMSGLVAELLSFSKAGMQQAGKPLKAVDAAEVVSQAVAREAAAVEVSTEQGLRVMADQESLVRAVSNLIRNAVRYAGDAGPISITVRREKDEVVIAVSDAGPGLPEEEIDRVFTPFYRLENSRNRTSGGVGLGLAIVRNSIEACKGTVRCRNRVPSGLEVEIRLQAAY